MAVDEVTRGYRVPVSALLLLGVLLLGHLAKNRFRIDETAVLLFGCPPGYPVLGIARLR
jgi:hypothetical protein